MPFCTTPRTAALVAAFGALVLGTRSSVQGFEPLSLYSNHFPTTANKKFPHISHPTLSATSVTKNIPDIERTSQCPFKFCYSKCATVATPLNSQHDVHPSKKRSFSTMKIRMFNFKREIMTCITRGWLLFHSIKATRTLLPASTSHRLESNLSASSTENIETLFTILCDSDSLSPFKLPRNQRDGKDFSISF